VTEIVRNLSIVFASFFLLLPGILLGFRLSFATEAVVLTEPHMAGAFMRSFALTEGRFERWLEMIVTSVVLVLLMLLFGGFVAAVLSLAFPGPGLSTWLVFSQVPALALMPVIQYAWTFFYLRLVETESPGIEVGPAYAAAESKGDATSPAPGAVEAPVVADAGEAPQAGADAGERPALAANEGEWTRAADASASPGAGRPEAV